MLGTQTALFDQCAHMTDDFLGLSKVAESECHHVWGSSCSESRGTFPESVGSLHVSVWQRAL